MWSGTRARYLECGVLAHGFARVRCESCKDKMAGQEKNTSDDDVLTLR